MLGTSALSPCQVVVPIAHDSQLSLFSIPSSISFGAPAPPFEPWQTDTSDGRHERSREPDGAEERSDLRRTSERKATATGALLLTKSASHAILKLITFDIFGLSNAFDFFGLSNAFDFFCL